MVLAIQYCEAQNFKYEIIDEANYSPSDNIIPCRNGFLEFESEANKKFFVAGLNLNKMRMGIKINKLDNTLKVIGSKELFNGEKRLLPGMYSAFKFQNNNCLVYQQVNDGERLGNIKLARIDEESLEINNETVLVNFEKNNISFDTRKVIKRDIVTYITQMSQGKKMLLSVTEPETKKDDKKIVFLTVYDETLKLVMERKIVFKEDMVHIVSYLCDDSGRVYISYWNGEYATKKREVAEEEKKIMIVDPKNINTKIVSFKIEGKSISYSGLVYSPSQKKVYIMGAYSKGMYENHTGIFHATIDESMTLSGITKTDFNQALVRKFDDDGYGNSKEKKFGLSRYLLPYYTVRGDGTVDLVMYYFEEGIPDRSGTTYYGGNFLDAHIVKNEITFTRVPRNIISPNNRLYLAFTTFSKDENLNILYNESEKNIERNIDEKPKSAIVQKSEICASTISKAGNLQRQLLLRGFSGKNIGLLNKIYPINNNTFFILIEKLNFANMSTGNTKFAKITAD